MRRSLRSLAHIYIKLLMFSTAKFNAILLFSHIKKNRVKNGLTKNKKLNNK